MKSALDMDTVRNICKIGKRADCCRYLVSGGRGFECAKLTPLKGLLDTRVATETMHARGDNCEGKEPLQ